MPYSLQAIVLPFHRARTLGLLPSENPREICGLRRLRVPFAALHIGRQTYLDGKKYSMRGKFLQIQEDIFAVERLIRRKMCPRFRTSFANIRTSYREATRFFETSCELQHTAFLKMRSKNLHTDGQASLRPSARDGNPRNAG